MAMMFRLLYNKWIPPALPAPTAFKDHTILITGATGGLGLETAIHYVNLGASSVIITARTLSRGLVTKATIESRTGRKDVIQVRELDMSTFASVKSFVDALKVDVKAIDIVLLNAGVYKMTYDQSPDGWEETLQVNTLSTLLLGLMLLPWMEASKPIARRMQHLGFVSSGLHTTVKIGTGDFPEEDVLKYCSEKKNFKGSGTYASSKLFMMYGVDEIVKLHHGEEGRPSLIINTMCPGVCKSDLGRQYTANSYLMSVAASIFFATFAKSTETGARTLLLAAMTGPEEQGKYIKHYGTDEQYKQQAARNLTNEAGKKLQAQVWKEMLGIFSSSGTGISEVSKVTQSKL